jgi:hypothetical protein
MVQTMAQQRDLTSDDDYDRQAGKAVDADRASSYPYHTFQIAAMRGRRRTSRWRTSTTLPEKGRVPPAGITLNSCSDGYPGIDGPCEGDG